MRRFALAVAILVLALNTAGVMWLVVQSRRDHREALSERSLERIERLFQLIGEYQSELQKVGSQAAFPNEENKREWKETLRWRDVAMESTRIAYLNVRRKQTVESLGLFLVLARVAVETPKYTFSTYDTKTLQSTTFGNTSRLESLEEQFDVLMLELLRDLN